MQDATQFTALIIIHSFVAHALRTHRRRALQACPTNGCCQLQVVLRAPLHAHLSPQLHVELEDEAKWRQRNVDESKYKESHKYGKTLPSFTFPDKQTLDRFSFDAHTLRRERRTSSFYARTVSSTCGTHDPEEPDTSKYDWTRAGFNGTGLANLLSNPTPNSSTNDYCESTHELYLNSTNAALSYVEDIGTKNYMNLTIGRHRSPCTQKGDRRRKDEPPKKSSTKKAASKTDVAHGRTSSDWWMTATERGGGGRREKGDKTAKAFQGPKEEK